MNNEAEETEDLLGGEESPEQSSVAPADAGVEGRNRGRGFLDGMRDKYRLVALLVAALASAPAVVDAQEDIKAGCDKIKLHGEVPLKEVAPTREILGKKYRSIIYDHDRSFLSNLETLIRSSLGNLCTEDAVKDAYERACMFLDTHDVSGNIGQFDRMSLENGYVVFLGSSDNELQRLDIRKAFYVRNTLPRDFKGKDVYEYERYEDRMRRARFEALMRADVEHIYMRSRAEDMLKDIKWGDDTASMAECGKLFFAHGVPLGLVKPKHKGKYSEPDLVVLLKESSPRVELVVEPLYPRIFGEAKTDLGGILVDRTPPACIPGDKSWKELVELVQTQQSVGGRIDMVLSTVCPGGEMRNHVKAADPKLIQIGAYLTACTGGVDLGGVPDRPGIHKLGPGIDVLIERREKIEREQASEDERRIRQKREALNDIFGGALILLGGAMAYTIIDANPDPLETVFGSTVRWVDGINLFPMGEITDDVDAELREERFLDESKRQHREQCSAIRGSCMAQCAPLPWCTSGALGCVNGPRTRCQNDCARQNCR